MNSDFRVFSKKLIYLEGVSIGGGDTGTPICQEYSARRSHCGWRQQEVRGYGSQGEIMESNVERSAGVYLPLPSKGGIYRRFVKRLIDFALSLIAVIVLSPILLIIALFVRLELGSPVIFRQERPGLNQKIFTLYKFRSMTNEKDKNGELLPDSMRLTSLGRFLRSTSLDELPELFNILVGDMSIVGPRPLLIRYLPYYSERERLRHTVRPGLTGLAQVSGRNFLEWDRRLAKDVEYVQNISFSTDMLIILATLKKVLQRDAVAVDTDFAEGDLADIRERRAKHCR